MGAKAAKASRLRESFASADVPPSAFAEGRGAAIPAGVSLDEQPGARAAPAEPKTPRQNRLKEEALADFDRVLRVLRKDSLGREDFVELLSVSFGWSGDGGAVFDELCRAVSRAAPSSAPVERLDLVGMKALYNSDAYASVEDPNRCSDQLIGAIGWLFDKYKEEDEDHLTLEEFGGLVDHLLGGRSLFEAPQRPDKGSLMGSVITDQVWRISSIRRTSRRSQSSRQSSISAIHRIHHKPSLHRATTMEKALEVELRKSSKHMAPSFIAPSTEELQTLFDAVADGPGGLISKEQLFEALLPTAVSDEEVVPGIQVRDLDPAHTSAEHFVTVLEAWSLNHPALNHHLLRSMSVGAFGNETLATVGHFMKAYSYYARSFTKFLGATASLLDDIDPGHARVLSENAEEEAGHYDQVTIQEMHNLGLDPERLVNVAHKEVYQRTMNNIIERADLECWPDDVYSDIADPICAAFEWCCTDLGCSAQTALSAMYFGSELVTPTNYRKISARVLDDGRLTKDDVAFFPLHIDMDADHADHMRPVVISLAKTHCERVSMLEAVSKVMDARVQFLDKLVEKLAKSTGHGTQGSGLLYDKQATSWARKEPTCLSDFTGRPVVFDFCRPHATGSLVLDIGCGEGYVSRSLLQMGAAATVGMDISAGMVEAAQRQAGNNEVYFQGDATGLEEALRARWFEVKIMRDAASSLGSFDLAVAVFVFNYTTKTDMVKICQQTARALKPGGHFVFSVPHPFMLQAHGKESTGCVFSFDTSGVSGDRYFSLRDTKFAGVIKTITGSELKVKMTFHTLQDYFDALNEAGLEFLAMEEACVKEDHMNKHPEFFESVCDLPLHLVFKARKPLAAQRKLNNASVLDALPKKVLWSGIERASPESTLLRHWPADVEKLLRDVVIRLSDLGVNCDTFVMTEDLRVELAPVSEMAASLRAAVQHEVGGALLRGLDVEGYGGYEQLELTTARMKLAYYILCSMIGQVDGGARGRLFDVKDSGKSTDCDNVLFSVSNTESGWHTDGTSRNRVYDVVALMCIVPAASGGLLRLSNGCNAFETLKQRIPKFLLYELLRPIPRDVMENGNGKGHTDLLTTMVRSPELLRLRARMNSFPIFVEENDRMAMRYMRYWITTGSQKAGLQMSPLLRVAMDLLDEELDRFKLFEEALRPGDMCFCNNRMLVHARNEFTDAPDKPRRHQVRAWIQTQKF